MALSNPLVAEVAGYYGVCSAKERRRLKPTRPAASPTTQSTGASQSTSGRATANADAFRDIPVPSTLAAALAGPKHAAMDRLGDFYG